MSLDASHPLITQMKKQITAMMGLFSLRSVRRRA